MAEAEVEMGGGGLTPGFQRGGRIPGISGGRGPPEAAAFPGRDVPASPPVLPFLPTPPHRRSRLHLHPQQTLAAPSREGVWDHGHQSLPLKEMKAEE